MKEIKSDEERRKTRKQDWKSEKTFARRGNDRKIKDGRKEEKMMKKETKTGKLRRHLLERAIISRRKIEEKKKKLFKNKRLVGCFILRRLNRFRVI